MRELDIPVVCTTQPGAIGSQSQPGHRDAHQQGQWHDIKAKALYRYECQIVETAVQSHCQANKEQRGSKVQAVNNCKAEKGVCGKCKQAEAKEPDTVKSIRSLRKTQPAEGQ